MKGIELGEHAKASFYNGSVTMLMTGASTSNAHRKALQPQKIRHLLLKQPNKDPFIAVYGMIPCRFLLRYISSIQAHDAGVICKASSTTQTTRPAVRSI
jgi:hypothetical protein